MGRSMSSSTSKLYIDVTLLPLEFFSGTADRLRRALGGSRRRGELAIEHVSSRHELVFGQTLWVRTMMQSCASAAKLRAAGPFCNAA
jgi:hypothetical protein